VVTSDSPLAVIVLALLVLTALSIVGVGAVIFIFRKSQLVRSASPIFVSLTLVGLLMGCVAVLTFVGKPTEVTCAIRPAFAILSFGLVYISLAVKNYRIYRIFGNSAKMRNGMPTSALLRWTAALLAVDLILVILWIAADRPKPMIVTNVFDRTWECQSGNPSMDIGVMVTLLVYNLGVLVFGGFIAFKTRKVHSEFNESAYIASTIILITWAMIMIAPLFLFGVLDTSYQIKFAFQTIYPALLILGVVLVLYGKRVYLLMFTDIRNQKSTSLMKPTAATTAITGVPASKAVRSSAPSQTVVKVFTFSVKEVGGMFSKLTARWETRKFVMYPQLGFMVIFAPATDETPETPLHIHGLDDITNSKITKGESRQVSISVRTEPGSRIFSEQYVLESETEGELEKWLMAFTLKNVQPTAVNGAAGSASNVQLS
jgi:hypothetical protein